MCYTGTISSARSTLSMKNLHKPSVVLEIVVCHAILDQGSANRNDLTTPLAPLNTEVLLNHLISVLLLPHKECKVTCWKSSSYASSSCLPRFFLPSFTSWLGGLATKRSASAEDCQSISERTLFARSKMSPSLKTNKKMYSFLLF
jgi:hypothetical protein